MKEKKMNKELNSMKDSKGIETPYRYGNKAVANPNMIRFYDVEHGNEIKGDATGNPPEGIKEVIWSGSYIPPSAAVKPPVVEPIKNGDFVVKDSGKRQVFDTGTVRDTQDGKPRFDLIPVTSLKRLADLYARGAEKYSEFNWRGGMPYSRCYSSILRHLFQWARGEKDEDHLAAVVFGCFCLMHFETVGRNELDDMSKYRE